MDNTEVDQTRVASVKLRIKQFKNPKLEIFYNPLEDRIYSMERINSVIDTYEENSGYQWGGCNYAFFIWDDENPQNAVYSFDATGLDHPEMLGEYLKTILSIKDRTEI